MSNEFNQDERNASEEEKVLLSEGMPLWAIKKGLESGYEARCINPDGGAVAGNVVWGMSRHLDAVEAYWNGEIGKMLAERKPIILPQVPGFSLAKEARYESRRIIPDGSSSGKTAYEARADGAAWAAIPVKSALNAAKSYAKTHSLPWPPSPSAARSAPAR